MSIDDDRPRFLAAEPDVPSPLPQRGGIPACPFCGYRCGCCCYHDCQTPCPEADEGNYCTCDGPTCHGGHEPWNCGDRSIRYRWAKAKSEAIAGDTE